MSTRSIDERQSEIQAAERRAGIAKAQHDSNQLAFRLSEIEVNDADASLKKAYGIDEELVGPTVPECDSNIVPRVSLSPVVQTKSRGFAYNVNTSNSSGNVEMKK